MSVECLIEDARWDSLDLPQIADRLLDLIQKSDLLPKGAWELSVLACDDKRIAELNAAFRDKSKPTNVLSWPAEELAPETAGGQPDFPTIEELGDIAIAFETCEREANDQGKPIRDHVTHLLLHGVLHLLGYDHETQADAELMEGIEIRLLAKMGLDNPYSTSQA